MDVLCQLSYKGIKDNLPKTKVFGKSPRHFTPFYKNSKIGNFGQGGAKKILFKEMDGGQTIRG